VWHGLAPPYTELFAWIEGRAEKPVSIDPGAIPSRHAVPRDRGNRLSGARPRALHREWKWDGIRVQAVAGEADGKRVARFIRAPARRLRRLSRPHRRLEFNGAIDGELLILRDSRVQSFNVLQQRLNRKTVTTKLLEEFPAHLRAYDLLFEGDEDMRELPFAERRARLEALLGRLNTTRVDISRWCRSPPGRADCGARRPCRRGAGADAEAIEA